MLKTGARIEAKSGGEKPPKELVRNRVVSQELFALKLTGEIYAYEITERESNSQQVLLERKRECLSKGGKVLSRGGTSTTEKSRGFLTGLPQGEK